MVLTDEPFERSFLFSYLSGRSPRQESAKTPDRDPPDAVEGISEGSERQNDWIQEISDEMRNLSATIEETLDHFERGGGVTTAGSEGTVVEFWHAMGGEKALLLEELAEEFEATSDDVSISLTSKGSYRGTLDATLTAAENGNPPGIAQIFEIGTTRARDSTAFIPVEQLLSRNHIDSLLDPLTNYYRFDGTLHSVPFNASNPILAYNRDAFRRAGLDPDRPGRQPSSCLISELSSRPTTVSSPISGFSLRTLPGPVVTFIMIHYIVYQHGGMGRKLSAKRRLDKPCQTRT